MDRVFITIDGDDVGQRITKYYLDNDEKSLFELNQKMIETTHRMANYLEQLGFVIIFCGADGVAGRTKNCLASTSEIFKEISELGQRVSTFSIGVGETLRESYIALIAAKSHGKAQIYSYNNLAR